MIAAFATLLFLAVALALIAGAVITIEESGAKIRAALHGASHLAQVRTIVAPVRVSSRGQAHRPMRAEARLRAAA